jgi:hypothetical protein
MFFLEMARMFSLRRSGVTVSSGAPQFEPESSTAFAA